MTTVPQRRHLPGLTSLPGITGLARRAPERKPVPLHSHGSSVRLTGTRRCEPNNQRVTLASWSIGTGECAGHENGPDLREQIRAELSA